MVNDWCTLNAPVSRGHGLSYPPSLFSQTCCHITCTIIVLLLTYYAIDRYEFAVQKCSEMFPKNVTSSMLRVIPATVYV